MKNKYNQLCNYLAYPSNNEGYPDMDKPIVCTEWATHSIKFRGNKKRSYYCDKHFEGGEQA